MAVNDPVQWFRRQSSPTTVVICALRILGWLVSWMLPELAKNLLFTGSPMPKIWTLLTYPYVGFGSPIILALEVMWLYMLGGMIERDHGSRKFAYLWMAISVLGALPLALLNIPAMSMMIPGAILVSIWASRYPNMIVRLFMIIPIAAKWLGALIVAAVFFSYAAVPGQIFAGMLAISGCILGYLYARNMIPNLPYGLRQSASKSRPTRAQKAMSEEYYDDVYRREKEREEKERLRKLFEGNSEDKK